MRRGLRSHVPRPAPHPSSQTWFGCTGGESYTQPSKASEFRRSPAPRRAQGLAQLVCALSRLSLASTPQPNSATQRDAPSGRSFTCECTAYLEKASEEKMRSVGAVFATPSGGEAVIVRVA